MVQVGDTIGRFTVLGVLGTGGIANVYLVRHAALESLHALKLLHHTRGEMGKRLLQEGRIQANLRHPHIVAVTDILEVGEQIGLVLEYVDGPSLRDVLAEGGLDRQEALALFPQILAGVAAAHRADVLHRDLKPGNVLLSVMGGGVLAKVSDFGIAKVATEAGDAPITQVGTLLGTVGYMAPEQLSIDAKVDRRTDVFALGCILYEMLSGKTPFLRGDVLATAAATRKGVHRPLAELAPDLPAAVTEAVERAIRPSPDDRFPSCEAFAEALYERGFQLEGGVAGAALRERVEARPSSPVSAASTDLEALRRSIEGLRRAQPGPPTVPPVIAATIVMPAPLRAPPVAPAPAPVPAARTRLSAAERRLLRAWALRAATFSVRYLAGPAVLLGFFAWREAHQGAAVVREVRAERAVAQSTVTKSLEVGLGSIPELAALGGDTRDLDTLVVAYAKAPTFEERLAAGDRVVAEMQRELAQLKLADAATREDAMRRDALERRLLQMDDQLEAYRVLEGAWAEQLGAREAALATTLGLATDAQ
ncbi:MAG: serine/threonine-protein kinase [Myxococcota bacterium]